MAENRFLVASDAAYHVFQGSGVLASWTENKTRLSTAEAVTFNGTSDSGSCSNTKDVQCCGEIGLMGTTAPMLTF